MAADQTAPRSSRDNIEEASTNPAPHALRGSQGVLLPLRGPLGLLLALLLRLLFLLYGVLFLTLVLILLAFVSHFLPPLLLFRIFPCPGRGTNSIRTFLPPVLSPIRATG
jgi:hypothetical protein